MRRALATSGLLLALALVAGCSSGNAPPPAPPAPQVNPSPPPPRRADNSDQCGAKALSWLVGRPKSEIPVPVDLSQRRVACTTCPVTMDYSPRRLNIFFDADTGVIKEVKCG